MSCSTRSNTWAVIMILTVASTVLADRAGPEPTSFHCRGFDFVAEVFPPESRQNPGKQPLCYVYKVGHPGGKWTVDAQLQWKGELPPQSEPAPYRAVVSMDGVLVVFNEVAREDQKNTVAIYDTKGKLVKSYAYADIIRPGKHPPRVLTTDPSWTEGAQFYFLTNPARLYIICSWGQVMEFNLSDGQFKTGEDFPDLNKVRQEKHVGNEKTDIWSTSLRFSSITDVHAAKVATPATQPQADAKVLDVPAVIQKLVNAKPEPRDASNAIVVEGVFSRKRPAKAKYDEAVYEPVGWISTPDGTSCFPMRADDTFAGTLKTLQDGQRVRITGECTLTMVGPIFYATHAQGVKSPASPLQSSAK